MLESYGGWYSKLLEGMAPNYWRGCIPPSPPGFAPLLLSNERILTSNNVVIMIIILSLGRVYTIKTHRTCGFFTYKHLAPLVFI